MTTLIIATRNTHKVQEIRAVLGDAFGYLCLKDFPEAPKVIEDQPTFVKNAAKKARELVRWMQYLPTLDLRVPGDRAYVLADDSGLEVDALNGAPGVHSARFAALDVVGSAPDENSSDADNNAKLLRLLADVATEKRTARFRCVLSLMQVKPPQPMLAGHIFEGTCEGRIGFAPRGAAGFGYDPLFLPAGGEESFAEVGDARKNAISHRSQALSRMRSALASLTR